MTQTSAQTNDERSMKANAILKLLQGCNSLKRLRKIQTHVLVNGLQDDPAISDELLRFCAVSASGSLSYAQLLFDRIHKPQTQAWNSLIRGYAQSPSSPLHALLSYNRMLLVSVSRPDTFTFSFAFKACHRIGSIPKCQELHGFIIRCGFQADIVVCTGLVKCYAGNGLIEIATKVFDEMPQRDLVAWNAMISCYSQAGLHHQALSMYYRMVGENMGLDAFTLVALLSSCAHVGALNLGIQLHGIAREMGFYRNVYVGNALIDMYAKCGSLNESLYVFHGMRKRDVFTWNSMIVGYGVHGHGIEAISVFRQMLMAGIQPNPITFLGLLCGCRHQGLVTEGVEHFQMMISRFNLRPGIRHYGCMVDLYGRSGKLDKALEMIYMSSSQHDPVLWRTLLGACKIHRNVEMGELAIKNLVQLRASNAGDCVLMATIYAAANNGQGVARMRKLMKSRGLRTTPGRSWTEIGNQIHQFVADDKLHPDTKAIYLKLQEVIQRAKFTGYVPEESLVTVSEERVGSPETFHSEKLAIAFGLMRTPAGTRLRIVKNLRVCWDCHSFTKHVSKAYNCEIIVRDRIRFHHFRGGLCSCRDYW